MMKACFAKGGGAHAGTGAGTPAPCGARNEKPGCGMPPGAAGGPSPSHVPGAAAAGGGGGSAYMAACAAGGGGG